MVRKELLLLKEESASEAGKYPAGHITSFR
jgi:hypothetical protein